MPHWPAEGVMVPQCLVLDPDRQVQLCGSLCGASACSNLCFIHSHVNWNWIYYLVLSYLWAGESNVCTVGPLILSFCPSPAGIGPSTRVETFKTREDKLWLVSDCVFCSFYVYLSISDCQMSPFVQTAAHSPLVYPQISCLYEQDK